MNWLTHWFFAITGASNEPGKTYGFWSGFGGTLLFSLLVTAPVWYFHHTCHAKPSCIRWGKYEAAGGMFKLCHRHHPDLGERPHPVLIHRLHREHQNRGAE